MLNEPKPEQASHKQCLDQPAPETNLQDDDLPEVGGAKGLEPTRYGDWERNGRCTDF